MPSLARENLTAIGRRLSNKYKKLREKRKATRHARKNKLPRKAMSVARKRDCLRKTGNKCHVCGKKINITNFHADHVKHRARGGLDLDKNYLPACAECNGLRWQMLPEEMVEVLRLGVWARREIERQSRVGRIMANAFGKRGSKPVKKA